MNLIQLIRNAHKETNLKVNYILNFIRQELCWPYTIVLHILKFKKTKIKFL